MMISRWMSYRVRTMSIKRSKMEKTLQAHLPKNVEFISKPKTLHTPIEISLSNLVLQFWLFLLTLWPCTSWLTTISRTLRYSRMRWMWQRNWSHSSHSPKTLKEKCSIILQRKYLTVTHSMSQKMQLSTCITRLRHCYRIIIRIEIYCLRVIKTVFMRYSTMIFAKTVW